MIRGQKIISGRSAAEKRKNERNRNPAAGIAGNTRAGEKHHINRVLLFGSRARGDFKRTSDIDLAAEGGDFDRFALDVEEETSTLLKYDIVDLNRAMQEELREAILREGIVIFEKI